MIARITVTVNTRGQSLLEDDIARAIKELVNDRFISYWDASLDHAVGAVLEEPVVEVIR